MFSKVRRDNKGHPIPNLSKACQFVYLDAGIVYMDLILL